MAVPDHLLRFPTGAAIDSLAKRFDLPNTRDMQDWEWEVADRSRIDEFMSAYESGDLSEDEQFVLMEILLQSFADLEAPLEVDDRWARVLRWLDENIDVHAHSVWYWSDLDQEMDKYEGWSVTPFVREVLVKHRSRLDPEGEA
ncbi:MAG: hypothetical protein ND807_06515 [Vicinamibacterales bacterium]|nr:hypothetical protein [Vicinamibacterales bacterium]